MNALIEVLYNYAYEQKMPYYLESSESYQDCKSMSRQQYKQLQEMLSPQASEKIEDYLGEHRTIHTLELEAMFLAGVSIGQELSRL